MKELESLITILAESFMALHTELGWEFAMRSPRVTSLNVTIHGLRIFPRPLIGDRFDRRALAV
jgi:hypothetical protein